MRELSQRDKAAPLLPERSSGKSAANWSQLSLGLLFHFFLLSVFPPTLDHWKRHELRERLCQSFELRWVGEHQEQTGDRNGFRGEALRHTPGDEDLASD